MNTQNESPNLDRYAPLIEAFVQWFKSSFHKESEKAYDGKTTYSYLTSLSKADFIQFFFEFSREGGGIQSKGYRKAPMFIESLKNEYQKYRKFLLEPFSDNFNVEYWLDQTDGFKGFGAGLSTIYLNRIDRTKYCVVNDKSIEAFKKLGFVVKGSLAKKFIQIRDASFALIKAYPKIKNLYWTDSLAHFIIGEEEGKAAWAQLYENKNYWVFQGSPRIYNVVEALNENALKSWSVSAHKSKIKQGDKIILWITGKNPGCYALGTVTSEIQNREDDPSEHKYYTDLSKLQKTNRVGISIDYNLCDNPILKNTLLNKPAFTEFKGGNQGTTFTATHEQYQTILDMAQQKHSKQYWLYSPGRSGEFWDEFFKAGIMAIGDDEIGDLQQYNTKEEIKKKLQEVLKTNKSKANDTKAHFDFKNNIQIGDVIICKRGNNEYIGFGTVVSDYYYDSKRQYFKKCRAVKWEQNGSWPEKNQQLPQKVLTPIIDKNHISELLALFNEKVSLNQILYGPPGTGKTYKLQQFQNDLFTDTNVTKSPFELLREKLMPYAFWKTIAATLAVSKEPLSVAEIVENPIVMARVNPAIKTKPNNLVWADLQSYADDQSTQLIGKYRRSLQLFTKNNESKWSISEDKKAEINDIIGDELLLLAKEPFSDNLEVSTVSKRFNFITFHQKYSYEDFIEGIKPVLKQDDTSQATGDLQFELKKGIFYESALKALQLAGYDSFDLAYQDSVENRKNKFNLANSETTRQYALLIDEINRANISAVFGELITLIEDDKRMGADNEMWVELPYSNEKFCVPQNLYIIGTMNTADRSIALLDIALRRRFEFQPLYPDYMQNTWWSNFLEQLNESIYKVKKNPDFFIGHAFFINKPESDKTKILNSKIIPLLYEYCQNNAETVKSILTGAGVTVKDISIKENYQIIAL